MAYGDGSIKGVGLSGMIGSLGVDVIELVMDTVQQKAIERDREARIRSICGSSDLSGLRETLTALNYKPGTVRKYVACVSQFQECARCARLSQLRPEHVLDYLSELQRSGLSNATQRLHLCALRTVFDKVLELGITVGVKYAPRPAPRPSATRQEVCQLMEACRTSQERLVIDMLNRSELRPGQLRLLAAPAVEGLFGETARAEREANRPPEAAPLEVFDDDSEDVSWLLPSPRHPGPLSTRTIRRIVERVARSCGLRTTCTALRKAEDVPWRAVC